MISGIDFTPLSRNSASAGEFRIGRAGARRPVAATPTPVYAAA